MQVAALRPTLKVEHAQNFLSKKLWNLLIDARETKGYHATFGALDPV